MAGHEGTPPNKSNTCKRKTPHEKTEQLSSTRKTQGVGHKCSSDSEKSRSHCSENTRKRKKMPVRDRLLKAREETPTENTARLSAENILRDSDNSSEEEESEKNSRERHPAQKEKERKAKESDGKRIEGEESQEMRNSKKLKTIQSSDSDISKESEVSSTEEEENNISGIKGAVEPEKSEELGSVELPQDNIENTESITRNDSFDANQPSAHSFEASNNRSREKSSTVKNCKDKDVNSEVKEKKSVPQKSKDGRTAELSSSEEDSVSSENEKSAFTNDVESGKGLSSSSRSKEVKRIHSDKDTSDSTSSSEEDSIEGSKAGNASGKKRQTRTVGSEVKSSVDKTLKLAGESSKPKLSQSFLSAAKENDDDDSSSSTTEENVSLVGDKNKSQVKKLDTNKKPAMTLGSDSDSADTSSSLSFSDYEGKIVRRPKPDSAKKKISDHVDMDESLTLANRTSVGDKKEGSKDRAAEEAKQDNEGNLGLGAWSTYKL